MFIAMNRFRVLKDGASDFERVWLSRESYLHEMPGLVSFHSSKGPSGKIINLFLPHNLEVPRRFRGLD